MLVIDPLKTGEVKFSLRNERSTEDDIFMVKIYFMFAKETSTINSSTNRIDFE